MNMELEEENQGEVSEVEMKGKNEKEKDKQTVFATRILFFLAKIGVQMENSNDVGVFALLTNSYCLVAAAGSANFYNAFDSELGDTIPVIPCKIASTAGIGRMAVGNKHGLIVPGTTTDAELRHLRNSLPDKVKVQRVDEKLSALGNVIRCNDYAAIVHPDLSNSTIDILKKVLRVVVFRSSIAGNPLIGTYCALTNKGALVPPKCSKEEQQELAKLLQVPVTAGTVNRGQAFVGAGMVVNDFACFCGAATTATEFSVIQEIFGLQPQQEDILGDIRDSLIDEFL